ncbi:hypothetical protein ACGGZK_06990 [Agromyces sp. MMS24-K17]|uniref:hypothetical protein n=1 Tax=Agromyces sp. MMS24-K17 TaxID=3372850 RepID=UPI0037553B18
MDELELSRRLREARPDLPERGDALNAAAEVTLRQITATPVPVARRRQPIYLSVAAAVAVIMAVTVGVFVSVRPAAVYAAVTPPLLELTPIDGTSKDLLMQLSSNLEPNEETNVIRFQSWALALTVGETENVESVAVEPEIRTITHTADGSRIEVRRGEPYDSLGNRLVVDGYQVGELVWEEEFRRGTFPFVFSEPPSEAADYATFLQAPTDLADLTTGHYMRQLNVLLGEWVLTTQQTQAALEFLATRQDLKLEGKVVDRLGRTGISFSTESRAPGQYIDRVIVSDRGLGFLSFETTYVGNERPDVQAPAVVSYTAWE